MAEHSGSFGVVDLQGISVPWYAVSLVPEGNMRNWRITETQSSPTYRASNTRLGTGRVAGVQDWSGSFEQWGLVPRFWPGDWINLIGYTAPNSGVRNSVGVTYTGGARVSEVSIRYNWRDNEVPQITTSFEANGGLFEGAGSYQDISVPSPPSVCSLKAEYRLSGSDNFQEWINISSITWTIRAENPVVVNSSSYSALTGLCHTERLRGPIDFDLDILEDNNTAGLLYLPATGAARPICADMQIKLFTTSSLFWAINFVKNDGVSDLVVDPETSNVIEQTVNLKMQGFSKAFNVAAPTIPQVGSIIDPLTNTRWPFTLGV